MAETLKMKQYALKMKHRVFASFNYPGLTRIPARHAESGYFELPGDSRPQKIRIICQPTMVYGNRRNPRLVKETCIGQVSNRRIKKALYVF